MTDRPEYKVRDQLCPFCGALLTHCTGANTSARPSPGDLTLCIDCGEIGIVGKDGFVQVPTPEQKQKLDLEPAVVKARAAYRAFRRDRAGAA